MAPKPAPSVPTRDVIYFGTPDISAQVLSSLLEAGINIVAVVTNPDKRRGRGGQTEASPAKKVALESGITVIESPADAVAFLESHGTDGVTGVVVAYGRIIREPLLSMIPLVNLHFSLLPRWRGAAPVERAILAGDARTGSSIMQIEEGLDTGGVYDVESVDIDDTETVEQLRSRLGVIGARQIVSMLSNGFPEPRPQVGEPVHAEKISPAELLIDWSRPAVDIVRTVRVGGAHCFFRGSRVKLIRVKSVEASLADGVGAPGVVVATGADVVVAAGTGAVRLVMVQPEGKKPMSAKDWANGVRPSVGEVFGSH
ncbi:MAG: methionyl-tRNA formyltransferase [Actinomycetota bacterium]